MKTDSWLMATARITRSVVGRPSQAVRRPGRPSHDLALAVQLAVIDCQDRRVGMGGTMDSRAEEGFLSFRGHRVWYRVVGRSEDPGKLPVLCLHGGPGASHDYLRPLEALATGG